jgi:hypothetical protein
VWARAVYFLLISLLLVTMIILEGCATELFSLKLISAEEKLSHGRAIDEDLKKEKPPVLPKSAVTRYRLALIMDSLIRGDSSLPALESELKEIRDDVIVPSYLKVEAGYLLTLVDKMEDIQKSASVQAVKNKECTKEGEELKKALEQARKENEDVKKEKELLSKEIELLSYKLKKLEEIHIESVKRRGKQ